METTNKIRVAVLFGGRSAEHEVSLQSAKNVIQHLDASRFDAVPIGIDKKGNWLLGEDVFANSLEKNTVHQLESTNATWFTPEWVGKPSGGVKTIVPARSNNLPHFDVVFPALHGSYCEDGTLQGLLELADLPYVGAGVLASAVGMDKDFSKRLAINAGINVVPYIIIRHDSWDNDQKRFTRLVDDKLGYPVFVKPANTGSSIGITKVKHQKDLADAVAEALRFDTKVLVEKGLDVQEIEVAVLESVNDSENPIVSIVGEIKSNHDFYSYDAKYLDEHGADLLIPAHVSEEVKEVARSMAKELFIILGCEGMARVDLFLDKHTQEIYFNEINTLPGFTKISMYPKLMEASGIPYTELLTRLITLAITRHKNKSELIRNYND